MRDSAGVAQGSVSGRRDSRHPACGGGYRIHMCVKPDSTVHQNEKVNFSVCEFKKINFLKGNLTFKSYS